MPWLKLDDGYAEHPKVIGLTDTAFRLHTTALCYCSRHLTDGHVPTAFLTPRMVRAKAALELVDAGLWTETGTGWLIHDYLEYNHSRVEVQEQIRASRAGGLARAATANRAGGKFTSAARGNAGEPLVSDEPAPTSLSHPIPSPVHPQEEKEEESSSEPPTEIQTRRRHGSLERVIKRT